MNYVNLIIANIDMVFLSLCFIGFCVILLVWHKADTPFDLRELIVDTETNTVSIYKLGQMIALLISTWVLIHETKAGRINEFLFTTYMIAWSGANLLKRYIDGNSKNGNLKNVSSNQYDNRNYADNTSYRVDKEYMNSKQYSNNGDYIDDRM